MAEISIGSFCEGVSESNILKHIVERFLGDDVMFTQVEPPITPVHNIDKQSGVGGWLNVLNHCNDDDIKNALAANDYLIIQIDTDTCNRPGYDVNLYDDKGIMVAPEQIYERVVSRLMRDVSPAVQEEYAERIIFAICIDEIECWFLPMYYMNDAKKRCATNNCIYILNQMLGRDGDGLPEDGKNSDGALRVYRKILKGFKKNNIASYAKYNYGFNKFIERLDVIKVH